MKYDFGVFVTASLEAGKFHCTAKDGDIPNEFWSVAYSNYGWFKSLIDKPSVLFVRWNEDATTGVVDVICIGSDKNRRKPVKTIPFNLKGDTKWSGH